MQDQIARQTPDEDDDEDQAEAAQYEDTAQDSAQPSTSDAATDAETAVDDGTVSQQVAVAAIGDVATAQQTPQFSIAILATVSAAATVSAEQLAEIDRQIEAHRQHLLHEALTKGKAIAEPRKNRKLETRLPARRPANIATADESGSEYYTDCGSKRPVKHTYKVPSKVKTMSVVSIIDSYGTAPSGSAGAQTLPIEIGGAGKLVGEVLIRSQSSGENSSSNSSTHFSITKISSSQAEADLKQAKVKTKAAIINKKHKPDQHSRTQHPTDTDHHDFQTFHKPYHDPETGGLKALPGVTYSHGVYETAASPYIGSPSRPFSSGDDRRWSQVHLHAFDYWQTDFLTEHQTTAQTLSEAEWPGLQLSPIITRRTPTKADETQFMRSQSPINTLTAKESSPNHSSRLSQRS